ncbi:hypothetical protein BDU57DRAFT_316325 [Ampelomyces quisqualis]|uniref:Zn(2)-C6 fungal-type domain-containing protein n=1 Tax=Ampelomyces quisqualis TaxID=50730 RepID=A0A6A5QHP3_AMPQU|nr:hypothetical protein BDU57DRAFT_316325 [Ampelomyces quisqualis]
MGDNNGYRLSHAQKRCSEDAGGRHDDGRRRAPPSRMRACAECKKHKIRCEPVVGKSKCAKCIRSGVECVPYNLNQRFLEEDASWKANATVKLSQLRSAVQLLLRHSNLPDLEHASSPVLSSRNWSPSASVVSDQNMVVAPLMDMSRGSTAELEDSGLATVPMDSLYDLMRIRTLSSDNRHGSSLASPKEDFIAQGRVSLKEAEELFGRFMKDIRLYLWAGILFPYKSLEAVRGNSSLLTAAMLTIAALHTPGGDEALQKCYNIFVSLAYNTCLSRPQNLDDIRAQALAAFYLSNLSWKLSGLAVRSAVELNVHQSFQKLMRGHDDQRDNVRLWYALYVCEHQCSIAYGRPATIHEDAAIKNIEQFLDSPHIKPEDVRLCAQVSLFRILTEAYNTFGSDPDHALTEADLHQLHFFNVAIEQWRPAWESRSADSRGIGSYPSKGVVLYYHFARVHLNSLALRALPLPNPGALEALSYDRREAAKIAISAATSTLVLIFEEPDLRSAMPAVPVFTHTMVAFCATFLLKIVKTWGHLAPGHQSPMMVNSDSNNIPLDLNVPQILALARRSADFLAKVAENVNEKHLTSHIVQGINDLLDGLDVIDTPGSANTFEIDGLSEIDTLHSHTSGSAASEVAFGTNDLEHFGFGFDENFLKQVSYTNLDFWETPSY